MLVMGAFGFSSGLPYILIFSTLTAWLRDVDISLSSIGFFAWISLTYSLKFLWSPFVDRFPIPFLAKYGKRKSWIIVAQLAIFLSLLALSAIDPKNNISLFILFAFFIAFSGSIQDIAIDAFRIEYAEIEDQGNLAAAYQFGYRLAILVATSLALILADSYGWSKTYEVMAALMCLGFIGVFISKKEIINDELEKLNFLESFVEPLKDFGSRFGVYLASMLLLIVATYRLTDIVMGPMANPFYLDMGYTLTQIGSVVKIVALGASIVGIFIGGILIKRISLYYSLVTGAFLVMLTNLCFSYVAITNEVFFQFGFVSIPIKLSFIVGLDSIAAGIVGTVNITFLTSLVSKKYTAVQYALLSSFMMLPGKIFSGFSGVLASYFQSFSSLEFGWMYFYIATSLLTIPSIVFIMINKNFFIKHE